MVDSSIVVAVIGGIFGLAGAGVAGWFAVKQTRTAAHVEAKADIIKTETEAKADILATKTESEAKRIDQLLDTTMDLIRNLQAENRQQRDEMTSMTKQHAAELLQIRNRMNELDRLMAVCVEERGTFKVKMTEVQAMYDALEAQFKGTAAYQAGKIADRRNGNGAPTKPVKGKIKGKIEGQME